MLGFRPFFSPSFRSKRPSAGLVCLACALLLHVATAQHAGESSNSATPANSAASEPTFSATVKVVNLLATVRNKRGQIISNLSKEDLSLEEDGRLQTIKYFIRETDLPLKLGLLVDTSMSTLEALPEERSASTIFLDQVVRAETDSAFVVHFDRQVELLQDLTSSKQKLASAMDQIEPTQGSDHGNSGSPGGYPGAGRSGHHHHGGGTLLYDAVFLASDELMQKQQGRKALILLTDGDDRGSKTSLNSAIESAQRSNTLVYCIYFKGQAPGSFGGYGGRHGGWNRGGMGRSGGGPGGYPQESSEDGKKVLERIAKETGGRMFEISGKQPIDQIYSQIQEELRNQYNIGYTPDRAGATSAYHKIHLAAKDKNDIVQTRDGYYD